jgi:phosphate-selective porin OprO and OprP
MKKTFVNLLFLLASLSLGGTKIWAQDDSSGLEDKVKALEARLDALEAQGLTTTASAGKVPALLSFEHNYLDISTPDGKFVFKLGGVVQADDRNYFKPATAYDDYLPLGSTPYPELGATGATANKSSDTFLDRKVRLDLWAVFDQLVGLRYQGEFGATGYAVQDAYAFIKADPAFQFQAGQFKTPIGLERLQNDTDTLFAERALPTDLVPNRDLGFELTGNLSGVIAYSVDLSNGTPDNWSPNNADDQSLTDGKDLSGRLFFTPFQNEDSFLKKLGLGISGSDQWNVNWNSNAYPNYFLTSLGQSQFFAYRNGVAPQGDFYHWSPQGYYYNGPLGLLGEYVQSIQNAGTSTATAANLTDTAFLVEASWVIGGKASYLGAVADKPLDLSKGHWGALEVAVRAHQLVIDPKAFSNTAASNLAATNSAQQATAFGAGLNWIFDPHFKLVFDWEQTNFVEGPQVTPNVNGTVARLLPEDVFTVRAQANF